METIIKQKFNNGFEGPIRAFWFHYRYFSIHPNQGACNTGQFHLFYGKLLKRIRSFSEI